MLNIGLWWIVLAGSVFHQGHAVFQDIFVAISTEDQTCNLTKLDADTKCDTYINRTTVSDNTQCWISNATDDVTRYYRCSGGIWLNIRGQTETASSVHREKRGALFGLTTLLSQVLAGIVGALAAAGGASTGLVRRMPPTTKKPLSFRQCKPPVTSFTVQEEEATSMRVDYVRPWATDHTDMESTTRLKYGLATGSIFSGDIYGKTYSFGYEASDKTGETKWCYFGIIVKVIGCREPVRPRHGSLKCTRSDIGFIYGNRCTYACNNGYSVVNTARITSKCRSDGTMSLTGYGVPICEKITCTKPDSPQHGTFDCSDGYKYFTLCTVRCDDGYATKVTTQIMCQDSGQWSYRDYINACKAISITPKTFSTERGSSWTWTWTPSLSNSTTESSSLEVTCKHPRDEIGDVVMEFNCSSPTYTYGSECILSCQWNIPLIGSDVIVCEKNDSTSTPESFWSYTGDHAPECTEACPIGLVLDDITRTCMECPKGTYMDSDAGTVCTSCPVGTSTRATGSKYSDDCIPLCSPGSVSYDEVEPCRLCPKKQYQSGTGQSQCLHCPSGKTTQLTGSDGEEDCQVCPDIDSRSFGASITCDGSLETAMTCTFKCRLGKMLASGLRMQTYTCGHQTVYKWQPNFNPPSCGDPEIPDNLRIQIHVRVWPRIDCESVGLMTSEYEQALSVTLCLDAGTCTPNVAINGCDNSSRRKRSTSGSDVIITLTASLHLTGGFDLDNLVTNNIVSQNLQDFIGIFNTMETTAQQLTNDSSTLLSVTPGGVTYSIETSSTTTAVGCSDGFVGTEGVCVPCPVGSWSNSRVCILCDLGTYQDQTGMVTCVSCPVGYTTPSIGSVVASDCSVPTSMTSDGLTTSSTIPPSSSSVPPQSSDIPTSMTSDGLTTSSTIPPSSSSFPPQSSDIPTSMTSDGLTTSSTIPPSSSSVPPQSSDIPTSMTSNGLTTSSTIPPSSSSFPPQSSDIPTSMTSDGLTASSTILPSSSSFQPQSSDTYIIIGCVIGVCLLISAVIVGIVVYHIKRDPTQIRSVSLSNIKAKVHPQPRLNNAYLTPTKPGFFRKGLQANNRFGDLYDN